MSKNDISIIIPTFKRHSTLIRAINSVLAQTKQVSEIIIVNDDHDDKKVLEIIAEFPQSNIHTLNNERKKGANGARNTGISHAKSDYIAFLDDDDEFCNTHIEEIHKKITKYNGNVNCIVSSYLISIENKWIESKFYKDNIDKMILFIITLE